MDSYNPAALSNTTQMTVYFGHCDLVGGELCYHSQRLAQHAVLNNIYVVLSSFLVRKRILQSSNFKYQQALLVAFVAYLPALLTLVSSLPLTENID